MRKLAVDPGVPGENGALGLLAAFTKSAGHQRLVQTLHSRTLTYGPITIRFRKRPPPRNQNARRAGAQALSRAKRRAIAKEAICNYRFWNSGEVFFPPDSM